MQFDATQVRRVMLSGFPLGGCDDVVARLRQGGVRVVSLLADADAVVVPDDANGRGRAAVGDVGLPVVALREVLVRAGGVTACREPLEVTAGGVRVCDVELPRVEARDPELVPDLAQFRGVCLDRAFLLLARTVARCLRDALPCLLEGPTATAKTTTVQWVAAATGHPVARLNLSGQSETGELVGRFVPDDRPDAAATWRFQPGVVPRAMERGWLVLLDEVNLAEPQVIERLNSALERPPTLVLSEHDHRVYGGGGQPVAPGFRLVGTMNPAEYSGRSVLSPSFRDRWVVTCRADAPDEEGVRQLVHFLLTGEQPHVVLPFGVFRGPPTEPVHPALAPALELAAPLARLHCTLGEARLGRRRRERPTFTRRGLLAALELAAIDAGHGRDPRLALVEAVHATYVERLADQADRDAVQATMRAVQFD